MVDEPSSPYYSQTERLLNSILTQVSTISTAIGSGGQSGAEKITQVSTSTITQSNHLYSVNDCLGGTFSIALSNVWNAPLTGPIYGKINQIEIQFDKTVFNTIGTINCFLFYDSITAIADGTAVSYNYND